MWIHTVYAHRKTAGVHPHELLRCIPTRKGVLACACFPSTPRHSNAWETQSAIGSPSHSRRTPSTASNVTRPSSTPQTIHCKPIYEKGVSFMSIPTYFYKPLNTLLLALLLSFFRSCRCPPSSCPFFLLFFSGINEISRSPTTVVLPLPTAFLS